MRLAPREEVYSRIKKLQKLLLAKGISGIFVTQLANIFYYSGTLQGMTLFVPDDGEPVLFVRKNLARVKNESPLENVTQISNLDKIPEVLQSEGFEEMLKLGLELDHLPVRFYQRYCQLFTKSEIVDVSTETRLIRMVKSSYELKILKEAGSTIEKVYEKLPGFLKPGVTELQVAAQLEYEMRRSLHQGILRVRGFNQEAFYGHVLFGDNALIGSYLDSPTGGKGLSSAYPQGAGMTTLDVGRPVLVDYSFVLDGYIIDITRIFALGKLDIELVEAHQLALAIQKWLTEAAKPGVKCSELYNGAVKMATEAGLADNFMGIGENQVKFIGHGVGLELDELPAIAAKSNVELAEGMVLAFEPKFFFPTKGAVGIENTFVVRQDGLERLSTLTDNIIHV